MNLCHRALFVARLGVTGGCDQAFQRTLSPEDSESVQLDKIDKLGRMQLLARNGLQGKRLDETLRELLSDSSTKEIVEFVENKVASLCDDCAALQQQTTGKSHTCDGTDFDSDEEALLAGGLCIAPINKMFDVAASISSRWYKDIPRTDNTSAALEVLALQLEKHSGGFVQSKTPHEFGCPPAIVPAVAFTRPPRAERKSYNVKLEVGVDRVDALSISQVLLILNHEFFCHVYQFYEGSEHWPSKNDVFTEGYMNYAAFSALRHYADNLADSETLATIHCSDGSDLIEKVSGYQTARENAGLCPEIKYGTRTFKVIEGVFRLLDPSDATNMAIDAAVTINASALTKSERNQILKMIREIMALVSEMPEPNATEELENMYEILCSLQETRDARRLFDNLTALNDHVFGSQS